MEKQINDIKEKVDKIHEALIGNEYNDKGLVHRVKEVEDYQKNDKKHKWMIAGGVAVISVIAKFWKDIWTS